MLAETRKKVIELRFGIYKDAYDPETAVIKHSVKNISQMVNSTYKAVYCTIERYVKFRMVKCFFRKPSSRVLKPSEDVRRVICSHTVLQDSMHLSLEEKCRLIFLKWNVKISRTHLSNIYAAHGVKSVRPSFKFTLGKRTESEHKA
jgi:hypothetical protein